MAEAQLGELSPLIIGGIGERGLRRVWQELDMADGGRGLLLSGLNRAVMQLRDMSVITVPEDPSWEEAVAELFGVVRPLEEHIRGTDLGRFSLRTINPAIPNPEYEPPKLFGEEDGSLTTTYSGKGKYLFFSQRQLNRLEGPNRPRFVPKSPLHLSVVAMFREDLGPA